MTITGIVYRLNQLKLRTSYASNGTINFAKYRLKQNGHRPRVAAVMVGRNDDYMPDFCDRLIASIEWNIRHLVNEAIFVEWNPPDDRELLSPELTRRFSGLRAYVVPAKIHYAICQNDRIPLLEFHAKNVGIRRAKSDWVIATNADAAFGMDTVNMILDSPLSPGVILTAVRIDIPWREGRKRSIGFLDCVRYRRIIPYEPLGTGEFAFASRELWHLARGYDESLVRHRIAVDIRGTAQMVAFGGTTMRVGTVLHMAHPTSCTEGIRPHHGEYASLDNLPYHNSDNWGLSERKEIEIAERVWKLE